MRNSHLTLTSICILGSALCLCFASCSKDSIPKLKEVDDVCTQMDDITFMEFCYDKFDVNKDSKVSLSEAAAVTEISVGDKRIKSLKGIEYFVNLTSLTCRDLLLTSLDVSNNKSLTKLRCQDNQLTSLDVSKNTALTLLWCFENQLTSLDVRKNTALTELQCGTNLLTSLDVIKNTALAHFRCDSNQLTSLDVSKNTALRALHCHSNQLTCLDVSNNSALTTIHCDNNQLTSLDVSNCLELTILDCAPMPSLATLYLKQGQRIQTKYIPSSCSVVYK